MSVLLTCSTWAHISECASCGIGWAKQLRVGALINFRAYSVAISVWVRVHGACVVAVQCAIAVGIRLYSTAAATTWRQLQRIAGASIIAVRHSVTIAVIIRYEAAAYARRCLQSAVWACIFAVRYTIAVTILPGVTAAAAFLLAPG